MGTAGWGAALASGGCLIDARPTSAAGDGVDRLAVAGPLLRVVRARPRMLISAALGLVVFEAIPGHYLTSARIALAWDVGAVVYLALTLLMMARSDVAQMRRRADLQDLGAAGNLVLSLLAAAVSLVAIAAVMTAAPSDWDQRLVRLIAGGATILISWTVVHTIFAVHYAQQYYGDAEPGPGRTERGGLEFPDDPAPDYWDFMYFSFVIGMTAQVSDVAVSSKTMRRLSLVQGIVAFIFNTVILALTINIAASLL